MRTARWAPWLAGLVLVAGVIAFAVTRLDPGGAASPPVHARAPLSAGARGVALEFVQTAVARKNLARAWDIVTPELKQGMSRGEWQLGTIPVVPYPVANARVALRTIRSFTDSAVLHVSFVPRSGTDANAATFILGLSLENGHWLVSSWLPMSTIGPSSGK